MNSKSLTDYGWFDDASQVVPAFDPGLSGSCPVCGIGLLSSPRVTVSFLVVSRPERSYFYRAHKSCWEPLPEPMRQEFEWPMVNAIARGPQ